MRHGYLLALLLVILPIIPAHAGSRNSSIRTVNQTATEQEVLRDFGQILDLWRDGRYDELFERTATGRSGKEQFVKRLASAPRRPACCWEKIQDARVSLQGDRAAVIRARLGFEGSVPGTEYVTKGIKLKKEDGMWIISQTDLFSLANLSKKKTHYKYLPIQPK